MKILSRLEIEDLIDLTKVAQAVEKAYCAASAGEVNLPPVGHITFPDHDADCHIKYGHIVKDSVFVIKIATGFPGNPTLGLKSGDGVTLVMCANTGAVKAVLHDEMLMTDIRTGIGGAIATRALARKNTNNIVILGTGVQATWQIEAHAALLQSDLSFHIWGRSIDRAYDIQNATAGRHKVDVVSDLEQSIAQADVIVTVTGSHSQLFPAEWVRPGTHITAVGADAPGKQELDVRLVSNADVLVADLRSQCLDHGEFSHAFDTGQISSEQVVELGAVLSKDAKGRRADDHITIADLTGIAAQDIAIAKAVLDAHNLR